MSFSLIKPSGWAFGEVLTSAQMEALDADHADAIDGVGGGTYAPSTAITIGGSGVSVTGPLTATGTVALTGSNITIGNSSSDQVTIGGEVTFSQDIEFLNDVQLGATDTDIITVGGTLRAERFAHLDQGFEADGDSECANLGVTGELTVDGVAEFNDDIDVDGNATVDGNTTLGSSSSDTIALNGSVSTRMRFTGVGRVPYRRFSLGNSNQTISVSDGNFVKIRTNVTESRTYTLSKTGAAEGDFFYFHTGRGNAGVPDYPIIIETPDDEQTYLTFQPEGGNNQWALVVYDGSGWYVATSS